MGLNAIENEPLSQIFYSFSFDFTHSNKQLFLIINNQLFFNHYGIGTAWKSKWLM